jgi:methionyl-tRNA synthetase
MLMALGEPLPKKIYAHGWYLFGEDKMSKSKGNVIYADYLAEKFGVDGVRFYCLSEMSFAQDGNITYDNVITKYNSELANTLGNLVNRTVAMVNKYFDGNIYLPTEKEEIDNELIESALTCVKNVEELVHII